MGGTFEATAGFQDSDFSRSSKNSFELEFSPSGIQTLTWSHPSCMSVKLGSNVSERSNELFAWCAGNRAEAEEEELKPKQGTRAYFKDSSSCYIMDAKSMGNIGRYLNVSHSGQFAFSRLPALYFVIWLLPQAGYWLLRLFFFFFKSTIFMHVCVHETFSVEEMIATRTISGSVCGIENLCLETV